MQQHATLLANNVGSCLYRVISYEQTDATTRNIISQQCCVLFARGYTLRANGCNYCQHCCANNIAYCCVGVALVCKRTKHVKSNNFASVCTRLKHHDKLDFQWQCCRGWSVFNLSYISCFNYIESVMQKLCQPIYKKFKRNLITILILIIIPENISAVPAENKKKKAWTLHTVCSYLLTLINPLVKNTIQDVKKRLGILTGWRLSFLVTYKGA